ncbi:hypothetical protein ANANG_G00100740, partial [Anguilla anguilla]
SPFRHIFPGQDVHQRGRWKLDLDDGLTKDIFNVVHFWCSVVMLYFLFCCNVVYTLNVKGSHWVHSEWHNIGDKRRTTF